MRTAEGKTALDLARARPDHAGCAKMAEALKHRGPREREDMTDIITTDHEEKFIAAIRSGDLGKVKSMLAAKPDLIRSRRHGASPILIARYHGKQEVVADRTMRDEKGQTAGDHARHNGHAALAEHLG